MLDVAALTRRMKEGDEMAYRTFYDAYYPRLWRYLLVVTAGHEEASSEALQAALAKQGRATTTTSDGFMFHGKFYAQPGAMKKLLNDDFDGFCSLAGTHFDEITPIRRGEPLKGSALETSINSYKATWRKAAESSG